VSTLNFYCHVEYDRTVKTPVTRHPSAVLMLLLDIHCLTLLSGQLISPECASCVEFFTFSSTKEAQPEEDPSVSARLQRLQNNYEDFGMRRTVEGILVVHDHGHPHILMLQIANAFFKL
jgi:hypothetical protein